MKGYKNLWTYLFWMAKTYLRILLDKLATHHSKKMLLLVVPTLLIGCAHLQPYQAPECCYQEDGSFVGDSLILEKIPDPRTASLVLQLTNLELLEETDAYGVEDLEIFLNTVEQMIKNRVEWTKLFDYILIKAASINERFQQEVVLLSKYFISLYVGLPISECDKQLLLRHIEKQRQLIYQMEQ